jgi:hypothetical protein
MVFVIFGIVLLVAGIAVMYGSRANVKRRNRILNTPTSPIAQAQGNAQVEIKGKILPSEQGVVMAPFSGRHAVWCRVTVQEWQQRGRSGSFITIVQEVDARHFMVDDGSGQYARVIPDRAHMILDEQQVGKSGTFRDANPQIEAFLQSRGLKTTNFLGLNKNMRYLEELLIPNDNLYAIGASRRDPGPPVSDGYRMSPSSMLVLFHGGTDDNELILTNKPEDKITGKLLYGFIGGIVMTALGIFSLVGFAISMLLAVINH